MGLKAKKRSIGGILFGGIFVFAGLSAFIGICAKALSQYNTDWSAIAFGTPFLAIFCGVGGGIMYASMNVTDVNDLIGKARSNGLASEQKGIHAVLFKIGLLPLFVGLSIFIAGLIEQDKIAFVGVAIVAMAGVLFTIANHKKKQYLSIGPTVLELNPLPGSIGGQVGAQFLLKAKPKGERLKIRLECQHAYSSGTGNNRSTHTEFLFQEEVDAYLKETPAGYEVCGVFDVPENLPETDADGYRGTISWHMVSTGLIISNNNVPGTQVNAEHEFKRSWKIPVLKGRDKSSLRIPSKHTEQAKAESLKQAQQSAAQQIHLEASEHGLKLTSESGRNASMWVFFTIFGLIFSCAGGVLCYVAYTNNPMLWVMAPVFLLLGLGFFFGGIFISGRKLETEFRGKDFQTTRSLFGKQLYTRRGQINNTDQISMKVNMSSTSQDGIKTEYMGIYATVDGKSIKLVEAIKGRKAGQVMLEKLHQQLDLD